MNRTHRFRKHLHMTTWMAAVLLTLFQAGNALAMTVPATGSFAYDLYDIGVNQILLGSGGLHRRGGLYVRGRHPGHPADDPAGGRGCVGRSFPAPGQHRG